jgi:phage terminase small subunit
MSTNTPQPSETSDPFLPPAHLQEETKQWWKAACDAFQFEHHHLRLLQLACESWERSQQARAVIAENGIAYNDRFGAPRLRPEVAVERDARISFARLVRDLGLDEHPMPHPLSASRSRQ